MKKTILLLAMVVVTLASIAPQPATAAACFECKIIRPFIVFPVCVGCRPAEKGNDDCVDHPLRCCAFRGSPCDNRITP